MVRRLVAVVEALLEEGEAFAELSVERVVSEADISRSTFYVYFQDKGDLIRAGYANVITEMAAAGGPWWDIDPPVTRDGLQEVIAQLMRMYRPHALLMNAVHETAGYDTTLRALVDETMAAQIKALRMRIRRGQRAGFVNPVLLPAQTAAWLMWMAERGLLQLVRAVSEAELNLLAEAYATVVWKVLYAFDQSSVGAVDHRQQ